MQESGPEMSKDCGLYKLPEVALNPRTPQSVGTLEIVLMLLSLPLSRWPDDH